jgi:hypothetical protein
MNDIVKIHKWLINKESSFVEGRSLYMKYKPDNSRDAFLNSVDDSTAQKTHKNILRNCLSVVLRRLKDNPDNLIPDHQPHNIHTKSEPKARAESVKTDTAQKFNTKKIDLEPKAIIIDNPIIDYKNLPPNLQEAYNLNKIYIKQMSALRAEIDASEDNNYQARVSLLQKVDEIDELRKKNWAAIDAYIDNEKEDKREDSSSEKISFAEIFNLVNKHKQNITRNKETKKEYLRKEVIKSIQFLKEHNINVDTSKVSFYEEYTKVGEN